MTWKRSLFLIHIKWIKKRYRHTHFPFQFWKNIWAPKCPLVRRFCTRNETPWTVNCFEVCLFFAWVGGLKAPRPHELPPLPSPASPSAKWHRPCHRQWNARVLRHLKRLCIWIPQFQGILLPVKQKASRTWRPLFSGGVSVFFLDGKNGGLFVIQLCSKLGYKNKSTTGSYFV